MEKFEVDGKVELVKIYPDGTEYCVSSGYILSHPIVGNQACVGSLSSRDGMTTSLVQEVEETKDYIMFKTLNSLYVIRNIK